MYYAAYYGNAPAVRALLESGVDANKSLTMRQNDSFDPRC